MWIVFLGTLWPSQPQGHGYGGWLPQGIDAAAGGQFYVQASNEDSWYDCDQWATGSSEQMYSESIFNGFNVSNNLSDNKEYPTRYKGNTVDKGRSSRSDRVYVYYSNITCWGPSAQSHLFSEDVAKMHVHCVNEHHQRKCSTQNIRSRYKNNGKRCFINPASPSCTSESGTHGGEFIAINKYLDAKPIQGHVLKSIVRQLEEPLHFAAVLLRPKKKEIVLVVPYFWSGQGISDDNVIIVKQIQALRTLLGKSMIIIGDFNNTVQQIEEAGWLDMLQVQPIVPNIETTFKNAKDRKIDYILISRDIQHIVVDLVPDVGTPWVHVGFSFALLTRPREYHIHRVRQPAAIPIKWMERTNKDEGAGEPADSCEFTLQTLIGKWEKLDANARDEKVRSARDKASLWLQKQKQKTGIGILGRANSVLECDPKFQGEYKKEAVSVGEELAHASLSAEFLCLDILDIPDKDQYKYIGRGQYPVINRVPAALPDKDNKYVEPKLAFWARLASLAKLSLNTEGVFKDNRCHYWDVRRL